MADLIDVVFTIPRNLWVSMNRSTRNHGHLARVRRDIQQIATVTLRNDRAQPLEGTVEVDWTIHYPKGVSWTHGDPVNAASITKPLLDATVDLGLIAGDGPATVASETFRRGENLPTQKDPHQIRLIIQETT